MHCRPNRKRILFNKVQPLMRAFCNTAPLFFSYASGQRKLGKQTAKQQRFAVIR